MKLFDIHRGGLFVGAIRATSPAAACAEYAEGAKCDAAELTARRATPAGAVRPRPSFLVLSTPADEPTFYRDFVLERERRERLEAEAAGAPTIAEQLLALCPVTLMDAACELDVPYKRLQGYALALMRDRRARLLRGKLVRISDER